MNFIKLLSLLATITLTACASPDFNYQPKAVDFSQPPLDTVHTAYVGETMLKQGSYFEHEIINVPEVISTGFAYNIHPGKYLKKGEDSNSETYLPMGGKEGGHIEKSFLADPWQAVMAYTEKPDLCVITTFNGLSCATNVVFHREKEPMFTSDSFQRTLIYSGKVDDKINVGYREFSDDLARPAFNNDVEYDLSESDIIGYKGARIKVIAANNESIKYTVIRNFNDAKF